MSTFETYIIMIGRGAITAILITLVATFVLKLYKKGLPTTLADGIDTTASALLLYPCSLYAGWYFMWSGAL